MDDAQIVEILREKMPGFVLVASPQHRDVPAESVNAAEWFGDKPESKSAEGAFGHAVGMLRGAFSFAFRGYGRADTSEPKSVESRAVLVRSENDHSQRPVEVIVSSDRRVIPVQG